MTLFLVRLYQYWKLARNQILYAVFGYVSVCRHTPSCSQYAALQMKEHGTIWGLLRALPRVLRCF